MAESGLRAASASGSEVSLREVEEGDIAVFFDLQADPEGCTMAAFRSRERGAHDAHWQKILAEPTGVARTIVVAGEVVGNVVSWLDHGRREIGYWVAKEHWRRGVATRAVTQLVAIVGERPLYAWVAEHNVGSLRVLEKCGFVRAAEKPERRPGEVQYVVMELCSTSGT